MFTIFSKAAGYTLSQTSALLAAGHLEVAMPPETPRFGTIETIAEIVYQENPDNRLDLIAE